MATVHRFVGDADAKATLRETKGIGTEATRAKVLETLKERGYLALDKKSIVSTPLGREIIDLTPSVLKDPITTAEWESRLASHRPGQGNRSILFLRNRRKFCRILLAPILGDGKPAYPCPSCGAALNRRTRKKDGSWFWGCTAYPDCKVILPRRPRQARQGQAQTRTFRVRLQGLRQAARQTLRCERRVLRLLRLSRMQKDLARSSERRS